MNVRAPGNDNVLAAQANIDYAVRAVNAHDDLVAALRALVEANDKHAGHGIAFGHQYDDAIEQARRLLRDLSPKEEGQ